MFKGIIKTLGFSKTPVLSDADRAEVERIAAEDKLIAISMKAYKHKACTDVAGICVENITESEAINRAKNREFKVLPNKRPDGSTISGVEYKRAELNRSRDPWKSVYKRTIR